MEHPLSKIDGGSDGGVEAERAPSAPAFAAPATLYSAPSHRESDEDYEQVIASTSSARVINCKDDLQWIVQRWSGGRWRNRSFHRERQSLIQAIRGTEASTSVLSLPDHHTDGEIG